MLLNQEPDLEVCGEAATVQEALADVPDRRPDIVVVDISLAGRSGLELIKDLGKRMPRLPILVLSTYDELLYAERSLRAGARGYVMKQEPVEQIINGVRQVAAGGIYLSDAMRAKLVHKHFAAASAPPPSDMERLSDRELEVFRLIGMGHGTRRIAVDLHLSVSTIETHRLHIKDKLRLQTAPELIRCAVEWVSSHRV